MESLFETTPQTIAGIVQGTPHRPYTQKALKSHPHTVTPYKLHFQKKVTIKDLQLDPSSELDSNSDPLNY